MPKAIPDDGAVESTLALAGGAKIVDVNATVGQITHTFDSDLVISLIGPDATTVVLANRAGGSGDNFTSTVFDDQAATAISSGAAPFTGSFRPQEPLSAFVGKPVAGTWTLRVADVAAEDTGTLSAWGLTHRDLVCN